MTNMPGVRHFYHSVLRSLPFTGVEGSEDTMVAKTHHLLDDFMAHLKGKAESSDVIPKIKEGLQQYVNDETDIEHNLYGRVNELGKNL